MTTTARATYTAPLSPDASCQDAALYYRRVLGYSVLPIDTATKMPPEGFKWKHLQETPADEETIRSWYKRYPRAGVGIITGAVSNLWVVDIDAAEGYARLDPLALPPTPTVKTGKGEHRYFRQPGALRNTAKKVPGTDTRGDGGLVVAPPTVHPSGRVYGWDVAPWEVAPPPPPAALVALYAESPRPARGGGRRAVGGDEADDGGDKYARMLEDGSPAGQRHGDMVTLVGHYIARGLSTREIAVLLRPWVDRCSPPFPYEQLDATIRDLAAAEARKQARTADRPEVEDAPLTMSVAELRALVTTQRAELADWKAQAKAWEHLFVNRAIPDKAKRVLVHMHKRFGAPVGRPVGEDMPCSLYADEQDLQAEGFGISAYKEGRDILLSLGLVTRIEVKKKIPPPEPDEDSTDAGLLRRARGKDWFYAWGLDGPAVNALWQQLPTLTEIAPTERQMKAEESRKERLERAIEEEKPTPQVLRALKREVAEVRQDRQKVVYEYAAAAQERDLAREQAEVAARERDRAIREAQRIVQENQRQPVMLGCTGCGQRIDLSTWRCDDCRERERAEASDSKLTSNFESPTAAHTVDVTNRLETNFESPALAHTPMKPCAGDCGELHPHGWTCVPCRQRQDRAALHRPGSTAGAAGAGVGGV